jgi:hypothetical protein
MRDSINFQTPEWVCKEMVKLIPQGAKTVLEPTPGNGQLVNALCEYIVTAPEDFWTVVGWYDAVVMNPPFSPMAMGYQILYRCMEMTNTIIAIMPWLTLINSEKRTKDITAWGLKSVTHLPRRVFQGARVQCCILNMRKGHNGRTDFLCI